MRGWIVIHLEGQYICRTIRASTWSQSPHDTNITHHALNCYDRPYIYCVSAVNFQGWAGIPVPGHSQEWRPLIPFPNFGNGFFSFPSRSRISGMDFFHSLPVPEFREWIFSIPFPFPNFGNGFFPFPSRSRIDPFKVGNQKGKWEILRDASIPTFSASCTFHTIYMPSIC